MNDEIVLSFDTGIKDVLRSDWQIASDLAINIITETENRNDPFYALDALRVLQRMQATSGLAKAQILYYLNKNWTKFGIEDNLIHIAVQYGFKSPVIIKRYIDVWSMFAENKIPIHIQDKLKEKPINDLVPVMGMLKRGYTATDEQWNEITKRDGHTKISQYIRENVKQEQPRTSAILFRVDKSESMLYVINDGKKYKVAKLNLDTDETVIQTAINRLLHAVGVPDAI